MPRQQSIVGLLLRGLNIALLLQPIRASVEANSAYEFAKLIQKNDAGAAQVIHVQNYTVTTPSDRVLMELETDDRCSCRLACHAIISGCSVMSYDPDTKSCTLADAIERATPTPGATYTYLMPANYRITQEKDGLYYYLDLTNKKDFTTAQNACYERGFRLAIARSVATAEVFKEFHDRNPWVQFLINLTKIQGVVGLANLRWGDDTPVDSDIIATCNLSHRPTPVPTHVVVRNSVWGDNHQNYEYELPRLFEGEEDEHELPNKLP